MISHWKTTESMRRTLWWSWLPRLVSLVSSLDGHVIHTTLLLFYLLSFTIACDGCQGDYIGSVHFLHKNHINTLLYTKHQFLTLSQLFIAILVQLKLCTTKFSWRLLNYCLTLCLPCITNTAIISLYFGTKPLLEPCGLTNPLLVHFSWIYLIGIHFFTPLVLLVKF